jgi:hypothetical protein
VLNNNSEKFNGDAHDVIYESNFEPDEFVQSLDSGGYYFGITQSEGGMAKLVVAGHIPTFDQNQKGQYVAIFPRTGGEIYKLIIPGREPMYFTQVIEESGVRKYLCATTKISPSSLINLTHQLIDVFETKNEPEQVAKYQAMQEFVLNTSKRRS